MKIKVWECEHYEFDYDDLSKNYWCHNSNCPTRECWCKTAFEMQVCPYFKKKGNGRFIDGYTKDKVKTIQLEFLNKLYNDISKQFAITFDKLTEILNRKDKIANSMKIVSSKIEKLSK